MLVLFVLTGIGLGVIAGVVLMLLVLPAQRRHNIDYKERWESAVALLGDSGQLTDEQVRQITAGQPAALAPAGADAPAAEQISPAPAPVHRRAAPAPAVPHSVLATMASWDRRDLEVNRARAGLPSVDDLRGMAPWDKRDVLKARARHGTG